MKNENNIYLIPVKKYFYFYLKSIKKSYSNENVEFNIMEIGNSDCNNSIIIINKFIKYLKNYKNYNDNNENEIEKKIKILFNTEEYYKLNNILNNFSDDENCYLKINNNIDYSFLNKSYYKQIVSNESIDFIISTFIFQNSISDERYFKSEESIIMTSNKTREYTNYCINQLIGLLNLREKELKINGTMIITIIGEFNILYHKIFILVKSILKQLLILLSIDENQLNLILNKIVLPINFYTRYEINESLKQFENYKKSSLSTTTLKLIECIGDNLKIQDLNQFLLFINQLIEQPLKKLLVKYLNNNIESVDQFLNLLFFKLKEVLTKDKNYLKDFKFNYYILSFLKQSIN